MSHNPLWFLTMTGHIIVEASAENKDLSAANIKDIHSTIEGAEILRLIVRDNLGNAGEVIASALLN